MWAVLGTARERNHGTSVEQDEVHAGVGDGKILSFCKSVVYGKLCIAKVIAFCVNPQSTKNRQTDVNRIIIIVVISDAAAYV